MSLELPYLGLKNGYSILKTEDRRYASCNVKGCSEYLSTCKKMRGLKAHSAANSSREGGKAA
jgi:hypothetical protein